MDALEGKGWLVVSGVLLLATIFLTISNIQLAGQVSELKRTQPTAPPEILEVTATPTPSSAPTPDLSTPKQRDAVRKANLGEIKQALLEYKEAKGQYPATLDDLMPDFIALIPEDPLAPRFTYRYARTDTSFRLTAVMEDKADADDPKDGKKDQVYTVTATTPR